jgi:hypothetical protein
MEWRGGMGIHEEGLITIDPGQRTVLSIIPQAENFHDKEWFMSDSENHGYDGLVHIEPHDMV